MNSKSSPQMRSSQPNAVSGVRRKNEVALVNGDFSKLVACQTSGQVDSVFSCHYEHRGAQAVVRLLKISRLGPNILMTPSTCDLVERRSTGRLYSGLGYVELEAKHPDKN